MGFVDVLDGFTNSPRALLKICSFCLFSLGCPELCVAPSLRVVGRVVASDWSLVTVVLRDVGGVMAC